MTALALAPPDLDVDDPIPELGAVVYHPGPYGPPKGPTAIALMIEVMRATKSVPKDGHNAAQGFNFRGIDGCLNACGPAFRQVGVLPVPMLAVIKRSTVLVGRNQTPMDSVYLEIDYWFYGPEGDAVVCRVPGTSMDSGDKAVSKAMSVAYRTALIQVFALPTMETDPDAHSYERSAADEVDDALLTQALEFRDAALAASDAATIGKVIELAKAVDGLGAVAVPDPDGHPVPLATLIMQRGQYLVGVDAVGAVATLPPALDPAVRLASDGQLQRIGQLLTEAGVTGRASRATRLVVVSELVGRALTSSAELTLAEAGAVIKRLESVLTEGTADALIAELVGDPKVTS